MWLRLLLIILFFFPVVFACNNAPGDTDVEHADVVITNQFVADTLGVRIKSEWIDSIFTKMSKGYWFNGAVAYIENGCLIYQDAFGLTNFRTKDTLTIHSPFQLASVSKMFAAMGAMILKEDGKLDLDSDIKEYIPEFPYDSVSTRLLLTHRSGLSRYMTLAHEQWNNKTIPMTNHDMVTLFAEHVPKPYFQPDNGFHYCNTNYALVASVVEAVSGMSFANFVQERIFDPLGMEDSYVYNLDDDTLVPFYPDRRQYFGLPRVKASRIVSSETRRLFVMA